MHPAKRSRWFLPVTGAILSSLLVMSTAQADRPPVAFDGWRVNDGTIDTSASCSGAVRCTTLVQDKGFIQQQLDTPEGRFIRTIITDPAATGTPATLGFADENLVPVDNAGGQAIDFKQTIRDPAQAFESISRYDRHAFTDQAGNAILLSTMDIQQRIDDPSGLASDFRLRQDITGINEQAAVYTARRLDIDQRLPLGDAADPFASETRFAYRERGGWQAAFDAQTAVLDVTPVTRSGSLALGGDTVTWRDGETIATTWVAARDRNLANSGFSAQNVENRDQGTRANVTATGLPENELIDPFAWDETNLGPAPGLP